MAEYVDLVICKKDGDEKPMLFRAPRFSGLKEGEKVITENDLCLTVERSYSARTDDPYDELNFILHASGAGQRRPLCRALPVPVCPGRAYPDAGLCPRGHHH